MNRLFGQSKASAVPKPTLNDTSATLDSRVETLNKQIGTIDQGRLILAALIFTSFFNYLELQAYSKLPPARKVKLLKFLEKENILYFS